MLINVMLINKKECKALVEKKGLNELISQDGEHQKIHEKLY